MGSTIIPTVHVSKNIYSVIPNVRGSPRRMTTVNMNNSAKGMHISGISRIGKTSYNRNTDRYKAITPIVEANVYKTASFPKPILSLRFVVV